MNNFLKVLLIVFLVLIILVLIIYFISLKKVEKKNNIKFQGPPPGSIPYVKGPKYPPPYFEPEN